MWQKCWLGVPIVVVIELALAVACSGVWLHSFAQEMKGKEQAVLVAYYAAHIPVLLILPFCSRPWLWNGNPVAVATVRRVLGWDDEEAHWLPEGLRALASFLLAWAPFTWAARPTQLSLTGILALALEGFFAAEMVKHTEDEAGFFMCQMASATYAAQRLFGLGARRWWIVFSACLHLIILRSLLPFYEDVSTLLPEPHQPLQPQPDPQPDPQPQQDPQQSV